MIPNRWNVSILLLILLEAIPSGLTIPIYLQLISDITDGINIHIYSGQLSFNILFVSGIISLIASAYYFCFPVMGVFSDTYGRRNTLIFCSSCGALAFILLIVGYLTNILILLLLSKALETFSQALLPIGKAALMDRNNAGGRALYLGYIEIHFLLLLLSAMIGNYLFTLLSFANVCYIILVSAILIKIFTVFAIKYLFSDKKSVKKETTDIPFSYHLVIRQLIQLFMNNAFTKMFLLLMLNEFAVAIYFQSIYFYLTNILKYTPFTAIRFIVFKILFIMLSLIFIYPILIKKFSTASLLQYCLLLTAIGMFMCDNAPSLLSVQWLIGTVLACTLIMGRACIWNLLINAVDPTQYGLAISISCLFWFVIWAISALINRLLANYSGRWTYEFCILVLIACSCLFYLVQKSLHKEYKI